MDYIYSDCCWAYVPDTDLCRAADKGERTFYGDDVKQW